MMEGRLLPWPGLRGSAWVLRGTLEVDMEKASLGPATHFRVRDHWEGGREHAKMGSKLEKSAVSMGVVLVQGPFP